MKATDAMGHTTDQSHFGKLQGVPALIGAGGRKSETGHAAPSHGKSAHFCVIEGVICLRRVNPLP
jgi:hypothetical protein